jgi:hypothetical protein
MLAGFPAVLFVDVAAWLLRAGQDLGVLAET